VRWASAIAVLGLVAARARSSGAEPAADAPRVHTLADRVQPAGEASRRVVTIVVERGGACVAADQLQVAPPYVATIAGPCALTLGGPVAAAPMVTLDGVALPLPEAPVVVVAPPPPSPASTSASPAWTVTPARAIAVGEVTTAAELRVVANGKPTSKVDLNVRADGARVRALRWLRPGLAAIDVLVPTWTPNIELVIQHRGGAETHTVIAVDPGPPIDAAVRFGPARAGRAFAVAATVATASGARVEPDRTRIAAPGCVVADARLTCARPGPTRVVVSVELGGVWVPIATARVEVAPPLPVPPPPVPPPPPPAPPTRARLGWEIAARSAGASDGVWSAGLIGGAVLPVAPRLAASVGLGWQFGRARLAPVAPVTDALTLSEHQLELRVGVVARLRTDRRWSMRFAAGPIVVRQRGAMMAGGWVGTGLRVQALAAVGARVGLGARELSIEVGARVAADVIAPAWSRPDRQAFLEVGLAGPR
jgi:hypothetical protein